MYKVIVRKQAYTEALEAYFYYEEKQAGLGYRFLKALGERYKDLSENPQLYSYVSGDTEKNFRDVKLNGFPYVVIFTIHNNRVIVYKVHNTYKKPKF